MNRFEYRAAHTVQEAIGLLQQEDGTRVVAGATDVLIRWRQGLLKPPAVLSIKRIPGLDQISYSPESGLSLGTLVNVRTLERHPLVQAHYPALAQAASAFAGVQIRHLATVGGNVCNASPAGDSLPALLAYGAECRLLGPAGERRLPLAQFLLGPGRTALQPAELLLSLHLPPALPHSGGLYIKHSPRSTMDIATVGVAAMVALTAPDGDCQEVNITLGAVAPTVIRATAAEEVLRGQPLTAERLQQAAHAAAQAASPVDDIRGSAAHRRQVIAPLVQRTLHYATLMARGTSLPFATQRRLAVEALFEVRSAS
ncbi:MAG: xanthine dehydrogenase family protein subunit M [Candidatus Tectimicrobiota bacterium]